MAYLTGGKQTTINSTVTELFPSLAFNNKKKIKSAKELDKFIKSLADGKILNTGNSKKTFVDSGDIKSAYQYIDDTELIRPAMYEEKLNNAVGILEYLNNLDKSRKIDKVVWGYRAKPSGIPTSHAGDIFVFFKDNKSPKILGVSLKAGGAKTAEPKLNSYVRTTLKKQVWLDSDRLSENKLKKKLFKEVYSKLPSVPKTINENNWIDISGKNQKPKDEIKDSVYKQFVKSEKKFNDLYGIQNKVCREHLIKLINKDFDSAKQWIKEEFRLSGDKPKKDEVPLILVKAVNNKATELGDNLAKLHPKITKIKARLNSSSVQEWFIDVASKKEKLTLLMTIRSDSEFRKDKQKGKLGAYMGLKLLYRGYK
jgi:hypothetical protein